MENDRLMEDNESETPAEHSKRRNAWWILATTALVVVAGCIALFCFNPSEVGFFPPCVFHQWTGLHCPGCGITRGLHQLLHGNVLGALRYNPFMVILIPLLAYAVLADPVRRLTGRQAPTTALRPIWIWIFMVSIVLFGILRNIPTYPFTFLAPPG